MSIDANAVLPGAQPSWEEAEIGAHENPTPAAGVTATVLVTGELCITGGTDLPSRLQLLLWAPLSPEIDWHHLALVSLERPRTHRTRAITKSGPAFWGGPHWRR